MDSEYNTESSASLYRSHDLPGNFFEPLAGNTIDSGLYKNLRLTYIALMDKPTIWLQARERSAAARERYRLQVLEEVHTVLQSLAQKYHWDELYLFGSLTSPNRFTSDSDIDIAVSGLDKHALLPFIAELSRELGREVDVLRLEECKIGNSIRRKGELWVPKKH